MPSIRAKCVYRATVFAVSLCVSPWLSAQQAAAPAAPPVASQAADVAAAAEFARAVTLYDLLSNQGLHSFHCNALVDWPSLIRGITGESPDPKDPHLLYLQSVQLTVDDDLQSGGSLNWTDPATMPADAAQGFGRIRTGLQGSMAAFFQIWNKYVNGYAVTANSQTRVERDHDGYHLIASGDGGIAEEFFSHDLLLLDEHIKTPAIEVTVTPVFADTPAGRRVREIQLAQHLTGGATQHLTFALAYAPVAQFALPSHLQIDLRDTGSIPVTFTGCAVVTGPPFLKR